MQGLERERFAPLNQTLEHLELKRNRLISLALVLVAFWPRLEATAPEGAQHPSPNQTDSTRRYPTPKRSPDSTLIDATQVERHWKVRMNTASFRHAGARAVAHRLEAAKPAAFGFERVNRQEFRTAASGMGDMIATTANRAAGPSVDDVKGQWHMGVNRGVEA